MTKLDVGSAVFSQTDPVSPAGGFRGHLVNLRDATAALSGWRWRVLAIALGILATAALPPIHMVFLLVPAFAGWLWMLAGTKNARAAFSLGWWFGLGHFASGLYWIAGALLVQPEQFAWLIPFAIIFLAGGFAVFPALVAALVRRVGVGGIAGVLVLATAWTLAEWVRSWIFTGFPWNLIGTVWTFSEAMMQPAALFGTFGLGLMTVGVAAMPAVLGERGVPRQHATAAVCGAFAILLAAWGFGEARLAGAVSADVPNIRLRLVQPNIPQKIKWSRELRDKHLALQVALSRTKSDGDSAPTHVIWAETAATFFLANDTARRNFLATAVPPGGLVITGAPRRNPPGEKPFRVWNSLHALDGSGRIVGSFDKFHLVPFGEYVPFRPLLTIPKITDGRQDFSPGSGPVTLALPGLPPVSPLICYEIIFPGEVARSGDRPEWILNLTNDAWYGVSSGPYQHLAATRMRSVEEGLPVVRVANTGISAVIDSYGRTTAKLGLNQSGVVDAPLPGAIDATLYSRFGNLAPFVLGILVLAGAFAFRRRPKQTGWAAPR